MSWRQWGPVLVVIVALAGVVRAWRLPELQLQHWDEGAYALGAHWLVTAGQDGEPMPPFYAPPLFPVSVAISFGLFGVSAPAAIGVSVVMGAATVLVLFLLIRQVWGAGARPHRRVLSPRRNQAQGGGASTSRPTLARGAGAGLAGALFLATCRYHLIYSRMALTDALFVFLLLLALVLYVRAIRSGRLSAYALAGVATGLCQNTKYHGISVLVLVGTYLGAGWLAALLRGCAGEHRIWRQAKGLLVALAVTVAMYAPWAILVERTVGYEKLLAWTRQFTSFWHTPPAYLWDCAKAFTSPAVLVLAAVGALVAVQSRRPQARLVVLVFAAFVLAPTAYQPYPRLLLPAVALACGLAGVGVLWLFGLERKKVSGTFCRNGPKGASHKRYLTPFSWLRVAAAVLLVGWVGADALYRAVPTLVEGPAGYRRAAAALKNLPVDDEGAEIWTDVQHCMRFSMTREMRARTRRIKTAEKALDFMAPRPVRRYLAVDLRVLRYRAKAAAFLAYLDALDRADLCVQRIDNPLNDVTRLNSLSFEELGRVASAPETALGRRVREIAIYRIPAGWAPPR